MSNRRCALIGLAMIVGCCGGYAHGQPPEPAGGGHVDQHQRRAGQAPARPGAIKREDEPARGQAGADSAEQSAREQLAAQRSATAAAWAAVQAYWVQSLFGLISVFLLVWTLWYTRKTANAADKSTKSALDAAAAAMRSADAAEQSLVLAESTALKQSRAWVLVTDFIIQPDAALSKEQLLIKVYWKNFGATPALRGSQNVSYMCAPAGQITSQMIEDFSAIKPGHNLTIGAAGTSMGFHPFYPQDVLAVAERKFRLIVSSTIKYHDLFTNEERRTRHVVEVLVDAQLVKVGGASALKDPKFRSVILSQYSLAT